MGKTRGRKREDRIKQMKLLPFKCKAKLPPGIKCVYRALYFSEIESHITKHQKSIDSGVPTVARNYEVTNETTTTTENAIEIDQPRDHQLEFDDPVAARVAVFGPNDQCVYMSLESVFNEIDKRFRENIVFDDKPSEMLVNDEDEFSTRVSPLIPQKSLARSLVIEKKQLEEEFFVENNELGYEHQTEEGSPRGSHILPPESVQLESTELITILENRLPASGKHATPSATLFQSLFLVIFRIGIHFIYTCTVHA